MISGTTAFKVCKKKYNFPPPKKIALTKSKRCDKFNVQYTGIKIVWVISVLKKVLKKQRAGLGFRMDCHLRENHLVCRAGAVKNVLDHFRATNFLVSAE